ncbi:MAG: c-type cytochrome [Chlorobiota bacterium]|jgi:cytochrome c1|nr:c-type cytochrome [Chlorobiota bacterium]QQS66707.1 MAG: c-type cytochrome [Chlorobiota bacterium]
MKANFIFFISLVYIACASSIKMPTEKNLVVAKFKWEDSNLEQLQRGYKLFTTNCGGCHGIPEPNNHTNKEWETIVPQMSKVSKLNDNESLDILKFIISAKTDTTKI